jgi:uncharacterized repeat protein (TIGR03837 family)
MNATPPQRWDIFCRVVDNYGDIGVCWRLARQLASEYRLQVRLWVDELAALQAIWPPTQQLETQQLSGVEVRVWRTDADFEGMEAADVVVEAFACELPPTYQQSLKQRAIKADQAPFWFNLEYLSAEDWVDGCHGLSSIHPQLGLKKTFFFPGFAPKTGGLLREKDLLKARDAFVGGPEKSAFLQRLGIESEARGLLISLFGYENPALPGLLRHWQEGDQPITCLVPPGRLCRYLEGCLATELLPGSRWQRGRLRLQAIPFLSQTDYDWLLWACDLNFVRGEDSFVRAQWAAKPLIWHIYQQEDGAHLIKLEAFLKRYTQGLSPALAASIRHLWLGWNQGEETGNWWETAIKNYPEWLKHSRTWCAELNSSADLAAKLVHFCQKTL